MPSLNQLRPFVSMIIVLIFLISSVPAGATLAPSGQILAKEQAFSAPSTTIVPDAGSYLLERVFEYPFPVFVYDDQLGTLDISIASLPSTGAPGSPSLPVERVSIAMAPGMRAVSVDAIDNDPILLEIDGTVTPSAEEVSVCGGSGAQDAGDIHFGPVYSVDSPYPSATSSYSESFGLMDPVGQIQTRTNLVLTGSVRAHYIDIELFPVQYNPVTGIVVIHSSFTLKVRYAKDPSYAAPLSGLRAPTYDNMIVTPRAYVPTFQVLSDHHNATGVKTTVVAIEDVYSGKYFASSGVDNAEKLKVFIKNATDAWGLTYVTLAGDSALIPARHAWVAWDFATDLYFADIYLADGSFASWDANSDGKWGNWTDDRAKMDLRPDLHIGRLPAATLAQASGMVAKIRNYDNTTAGDKFFKNVTFLSGPAAGDGTGYSDWLADNVYPAKDGWYHNKLYNSKSSAANLSIPQNNSVGFMAFWGHGGTDSWLGGTTITTADIYALTNFDELPIVSIMACDCGNFEAGTDGFAETFLKNTQGGAIGVLAGTQTSNADDMDTWAGATNKYFHAANAEHRIRRLGAMYSAGVNMFLDNKNWKSSSLDYKNMLEYVMFGDPAATIGGYSRTTAQMTTDNATRSGLPGQNVTFNVSIENTGTGWADFNISFKDPVPLPWDASLPFNFTNIISGDNKTFQVNVTIPQDALAGSSLILTVLANSTNVPQSPLSVLLRTVVDVNYTFTFSCAQKEKMVDPRTSAQYKFTVKNTGNAEFPFTVAPQELWPDWDFNSSDTEVYISPDQTHLFVWNITPGPFVWNWTYELAVVATIVPDPSHTKYIWVNTTVRMEYAYELIPDNTTVIANGTSVNFTIIINNTGNVWASLSLTTVSHPSTASWYVSVDKTQTTIAAFSNDSYRLYVSVPTNAMAGEYTVTTGAYNYIGQGYFQTVNLTIIVPPRYDFWLSLPSYDTYVEPSSTFSFTADVTNTGNSVETFDVNLSGLPLLWTALYPSNVTIYPGELQSLIFEITITTDKLPFGTNKLTVMVTSRGSGVSMNETFEAWSIQIFSHAAYTDVPSIMADPGTSADLALHVVNLGNGHDNYSIVVAPIAFWYIKYNDSIDLDEYGNGTVIIHANPSPYAGPITSTMAISVISQNGPNLAVTVTVKAIVNRTYGLMVSYSGGQSEVYTGEAFTEGIMITNLGNADDSFTIIVTPPSNAFIIQSINTMTLVGFQTKAKTLSITVAKSAKEGTYIFPVQVRSTSKPSIQQNTSFTIVVKKKVDPNQPVKDMFVYLIAAVIGMIVIFVVMVVLLMRPKGGVRAHPPKAVPPPDGIPPPQAPGPGNPL